jgi:hypothetical protein
MRSNMLSFDAGKTISAIVFFHFAFWMIDGL